MNWQNYPSVLAQLHAAGLQVDDLEVGRRMRCRVEGDREKRGWYHLHELRLDAGGSLLVGSYGVWHGSDPGTQKVTLEKGGGLSEEQRAAIKQRMADDRRAVEAAARAASERAGRRATAMWAKLDASGDSEYLQRKCVGAHGVRFGPHGSVILPLLDVGGQIHGLQAIYPAEHPKRKRLGRDKDFWPQGLAKKGNFFALGSPGASHCCLVAEGYATAASLHEATGLPVVVAFDAGNLLPVCQALRARWKSLRLLVCADDDYLGKCSACGAYTGTGLAQCAHCGAAPGRTGAALPNAGHQGAAAAALAVSGEWLAPGFAAARSADRKGPTDFNDLHVLEGLHVVRAQVEAKLTALGWRADHAQRAPAATVMGEGVRPGALQAITSPYQLHERFALVYDAPDTVFDKAEHKLVGLSCMRNLCAGREVHRSWMDSHDKQIVRMEEVGFDPTGRDETVLCNLWGGWPTTPKAGACDKLLALGEYLCSQDANAAEMWRWLLRWLAYPIQNPGAKLKTAVVMHGPQGTGKNLFFEAITRIYGTYGRVVGQDAVEDKFNDWASRKLLIVADEVVARDEMYHSKNRLKVLVTSDRIRINPKNVASYEEANHVNLVFLSNEVMPMALERDDRRYAVIWTPPKWDAARYNAVLAEIDAGGIAALHDYLLHLDLGDFGPATLPPMTQAKSDLIELGMDSSERFFLDWTKGHIQSLPVGVVRSEDLYAAYRHWGVIQGVSKPAQLSTCLGAWCKRPGVRKARERHYLNHSLTKVVQSMCIHPTAAVPDGIQTLTDSINAFNEGLKQWKEQHLPSGSKSPAAAKRASDDDDEPF